VSPRQAHTGSGGNPRNGPRSSRGAQARARLIEAAKKVFERDGFLSARITDIATAAGASHGSFYHYFQSKEQIFREVAANQEVNLLTSHILYDSVPTDPIERIRQGNRSYLEAYRKEAKIMGVIEEVSRYDAEVSRTRINRQQDFGRHLAASIERLQADGLADPLINPSIAATALGGMVAKMAEMIFVQHYDDVDFDELVEQVTRLWVSALQMRSSNGAAQTPREADQPAGP
jgi:AcrR family transcriptional regulator